MSTERRFETSMRLTRHTDYGLRVLLYLGEHPDRHCSIAEIAAAHAISKNHLMKIVHQLVVAGYLRSIRGRMGGVALARPASAMNVGAIVRLMECDFDIVDCVGCRLARGCTLRDVLCGALNAFLAHLDRFTLDDLLANDLMRKHLPSGASQT